MVAGNVQAIVAGGSAGAIEALVRILPALPADFSIPIAIALHVHPNKPSHLAQILGMHSALMVKEAEDKEPLLPRTVYLAPPNYHLLLEAQRHFSLSVDEPVLFSRPAIDVLFDSAADAFGPALVGLLLTGGSEDGARGLAHIQRAGGLALVQAPSTATVPHMPEAALRLFAPDHLLPLDEIGPFLARLDRGPGPSGRKDDV
ncbi:MAG TPA: chemotaxis protein CheB [Polyangiaceae bacterium]|nr:chemotaxis protein CheB [Polyangiaceae bacterium]